MWRHKLLGLWKQPILEGSALGEKVPEDPHVEDQALSGSIQDRWPGVEGKEEGQEGQEDEVGKEDEQWTQLDKTAKSIVSKIFLKRA